jgi:hypothetical protein
MRLRPDVFFWFWILIAAVLLPVLAAGLPADAFFSGDPGVKFIATVNALMHPDDPFRIDLPHPPGSVPGRFYERFFVPHDGHAHALTPLTLPLATTPVVRLFGLRGAYVIPAIAFLLLAPALRKTAEVLRLSVSPGVLGFIATVGSPLLFYALEFWEHTPAVALLAFSTWLVFSALEDGPASRAMLGGVLAGFAVTLRPEAGCYVAGLLAAVSWHSRKRWFPTGVALMVGVALALVLQGFVLAMHSGSPWGVHLGANMVALRDGWVLKRVAYAATWLNANTWFALAGLTSIALSLVGAIAGASRVSPVLGVLGSGAIAICAARACFPRESLWGAMPVAALALVPHARRHTASTPLLTVYVGLVVTVSLILLLAPNDGGAQWGPRYLLVATPWLSLAAGHSATVLLRSPFPALRVLTLVALACSFATARAAYRELRGAKKYYARIVNATSSRLPPSGIVISDLWWFDQINAALYPRMQSLYVDSVSALNELLCAIPSKWPGEVLAVTTRDEPSPIEDWATRRAAGSPCVVRARESIAERELDYYRLDCQPRATDAKP